MRNGVELVQKKTEKKRREGPVHFCVRYAPMVRLAAPSAARPNTVLMEDQEQLKTESLCLSYSSTKASCKGDRYRVRQALHLLLLKIPHASQEWTDARLCIFCRQSV